MVSLCLFSRCSRVSEGTVLACCFSPCGQMFVTGSTQGELHLWSLNMSSLYVQREAHDLGVNCCQFSPQISMGKASRWVNLISPP